MEQVSESRVDDLMRGAVHFGSGGGGGPHLGRQMLIAAIREYGSIPLVKPGELDADGLVLPIVHAGAPYALLEKAHDTDQAKTLRAAVEARAGRECVAVLPVQRAGFNVAVALTVAAQLGLPCLDADLMRRCFPSIDMTLLQLAGRPVRPMTAVGSAGVVTEFPSGADTVLGELLRAIMPALGLVALISAFAVTVGDCARLGIDGSISECWHIGEALGRVAPGSAADDYAKLFAICGGRVLCTGTVVEVMQDSTDAFPRGVLSLQTRQDFVRVDFQNENLVVSREGEVLATVPDVISLADVDTSELVQTVDLVVGQEVHVIVSPVDHRWRTPAGLAIVGPSAFGYPVEPVLCGGPSHPTR
ncbi:DUF917 domain-containing protein [Mycolicibacterium fortuitum]|uniref:DUF917 domain-containing protein n=1 Tax=Mycolicibacterium fortuitum subsp. fortuitum DSM 46621 = ATCC 6841 = JCM 6387 TaxID=1214102 RepID=K0V4H9_MYCFO|nr:DUF917 domain-containing protein [Mycolicibacterium fortuitum]AIY48722.1 protein of unknown function DUF917 [Mycobacterium sp. VKM Ac-1817D]CRL78528.1 hypothetical protein CPGR_02276 [Mycolicibacter nonchromogenicus]AMD56066.1 hypothetical protein ATO49_26695 [Mycolicibacterium fortuitum subsp. fortuitum DSM 46621 = ATCC 6841 = JCM 6387]EJZ14222.1 hypothetical protein MFORT_10839 [Mycolicibacterium fortuitum subsp. fortuitum DSM 46621 = ATCC 6841 = JCM 6387]WEV32456.1 DUF917 domain-containi